MAMMPCTPPIPKIGRDSSARRKLNTIRGDSKTCLAPRSINTTTLVASIFGFGEA